LPSRPEYFLQDAEINRTGAAPLSELPELHAIKPAELKTVLEEGGFVLDVRPGEQFAAEHVPGSINIPLSGQFASWTGTILGLKALPVLIAESQEQLTEARTRLARVGLEEARGYLRGGVEAWKAAGFPAASISQITVEALHRRLDSNGLQVLDVRRGPEWEAGHIE